MKRSWIGLTLLLVLLAAGLLTTWAMGRIHQPIAQDLEQAADRALAGDWSSAEAFSRQAVTGWEKWAHFRACLADHSPVEEIDAGIAQLRVYGIARDEVSFAAVCAELAKKIDAVGDAHGLVWWNML